MSGALEFECPSCAGLGEWLSDGIVRRCTLCNATGWVECDRGGVDCPFARCECEAAWERQEQAKMEDF